MCFERRRPAAYAQFTRATLIKNFYKQVNWASDFLRQNSLKSEQMEFVVEP